MGRARFWALQTAGFPNFFIGTNTAFCNYTVCAESVVEWITDCIRISAKKATRSIAPTPEAEEAWVKHANEMGSHTFLSASNGWFIGGNIPGKARAILLYANTAPAYRAKCDEAAAKGYEGFDLRR